MHVTVETCDIDRHHVGELEALQTRYTYMNCDDIKDC